MSMGTDNLAEPAASGWAAEVRPPIGTPLAIGVCIGRVIRHLPDGFAVKFVKQQGRDELHRRIARTALV